MDIQGETYLTFSSGCGMELEMGDLKIIDSNHGDWRTDGAFLLKKDQRDDRNYINVSQ